MHQNGIRPHEKGLPVQSGAAAAGPLLGLCSAQSRTQPHCKKIGLVRLGAFFVAKPPLHRRSLGAPGAVGIHPDIVAGQGALEQFQRRKDVARLQQRRRTLHREGREFVVQIAQCVAESVVDEAFDGELAHVKRDPGSPKTAVVVAHADHGLHLGLVVGAHVHAQVCQNVAAVFAGQGGGIARQTEAVCGVYRSGVAVEGELGAPRRSACAGRILRLNGQ